MQDRDAPPGAALAYVCHPNGKGTLTKTVDGTVSELALRVEDEIDEELNFDAAGLRQITTVGDVLDLLTELQRA